MPDTRPLLPPNSTPLERQLAITGAEIENIPVPIRELRRTETCPANILTWLAWERSVDRWNDNWSTESKRRAVANAFKIHQHKGTTGAIRRVVEPLGYLLELVEWWQMVPEGPRGTFQLSIGLQETGITEPIYAELERLIDDAKRQSQHLLDMSVVLDAPVSMSVCVATYEGDISTVYPYVPGDIDVTIQAPLGIQEHTIDTLTVYLT